MQICERCRQSSLSLRMSFFNTQMICHACIETEEAHPDSRKAHDADAEAIRQGNYNFPGIGLPDDLARRYPDVPLEDMENTDKSGV